MPHGATSAVKPLAARAARHGFDEQIFGVNEQISGRGQGDECGQQ
jgi:hypothetical protein